MKKVYLTALTGVLLLSAGTANAHWWNDKDNQNDNNVRYEQSSSYQQRSSMVPQQSVREEVRYDNTANNPEAQKWIYNGSSAYRGGIAGQVAARDNMNDGDNAAFKVHRVWGRNNQFNANLRNGDTGQSDETRINQSFNN